MILNVNFSRLTELLHWELFIIIFIIIIVIIIFFFLCRKYVRMVIQWIVIGYLN